VALGQPARHAGVDGQRTQVDELDAQLFGQQARQACLFDQP
jgi:hypothetical protein